ncbi:N-acetylglucosamine-6-phosphate deacetylase [Geminicoccus harenae]|uniref:N-acetylglucosamine-6-phosphate deacetylase n=1 Tax=Geminicoccus harenae TaxID=2498453 RepID=UPI00168A901A
MKPSPPPIDGLVLVGNQFQPALVRFSHRIEAVEPHSGANRSRYVIPGFVDPHCHGGAGADVMAGAEAVRAMAAFHLRHGTTTLLPTTVTAPRDAIVQAFAGIAEVMRSGAPDHADLPGVHLEGPFINPDKLGAQPPFAIPPDLDLVGELIEFAPIIVATIAPEQDPTHQLITQLCHLGTRVQIGHSLADAGRCLAALSAGAAGFTHLFNAMSGVDHRRPGVAAAALGHASHAEIIPDLLHVHPEMLLLARRAIPGLYAITDAMAAAGCPPGQYRLGSHDVISDGSSARLQDGTLAGSVLTMDQALRNLVVLGLPLAEAALRTSTVAADYLGLDDRGRIAPGRRADLLVVDANGTIGEIFCAGVPVEPDRG